MRAGIEENEDLTIARFISCLNFAIRDRVELLPYNNLNDLVQMCVKVEQHILRRPYRKDPSISFSKNDPPKDFKRYFSNAKESPLKNLAKVSDKSETSTKRGREMKCFKCFSNGSSYVILLLLVFQVLHLRIYLFLLLLFIKIFKTFFQRIFLMDYRLLQELSTKLILCLGLVFPIDRPIRQIQLKQRRQSLKCMIF